MKTKWELAEGVDRSLMESLLRGENGSGRWNAWIDDAHGPKVVKRSPAKLVTYHETGQGAFYVKRSRHSAFPLRPQKYWFKECPARWEWRLAQTMQSLGIPVVEHLAVCEKWSLTGLQEDILVTRAFDGQPLHLAGEIDTQSVIEFVNRCQEKGMVHGDLHPANILVNAATGELRLADLKGVCIEQNPDLAKQNADIAYLNIHFSMPLSPELLRVSDQARRGKMAVRYRRCLKNNREFGPQSHGSFQWQVRKPMGDESLSQVLAAPDEVLTGGALLKAGRTSTVGESGGWVLKRYNFKKPLNLLKDFFRPTKAKRAFQMGYHLELVNVRTPRVIALAEHRPLGLALRSYLVMEKIEGATDLCDVSGDAPHLAKRLAKMIGRMHAEGFAHRDLKASNVLVDGEQQPWLIDLDGLSFSGSISAKVAVSNLNRLERGLRSKSFFTKENRIRFLRHYCRVSGLRPAELRVAQK